MAFGKNDCFFIYENWSRKGWGPRGGAEPFQVFQRRFPSTKMFIHGSNDSLARNSYAQATVMVLSSLQQLTHFLPIPLINCNPINVTWSIVGYKALRNTQGAGTVLVQNQRINLQVRRGCRSSATWTRVCSAFPPPTERRAGPSSLHSRAFASDIPSPGLVLAVRRASDSRTSYV